MGVEDIHPAAAWGLFFEDKWAEGSQDDIKYNNRGVELEDTPGYDCYHVSSMEYIASYQIPTGSGGSTHVPTDEAYRDEVHGDSDGFKIFSPDTIAGYMGFVEVTNPIGGYKKGDVISRALLNTLRIIKHRDTILNDSAVNLPIPYASDEMTEMESLLKLIEDVIAKNGEMAKYAQFYYPAASICHAYQPKVKANEELSPKFMANKWSLPCVGDWFRIAWYHNQGYELGADNAIFARSVYEKVMNAFTRGYYWGLPEGYSHKVAYYAALGNPGSTYIANKSSPWPVRPIVSF